MANDKQKELLREKIAELTAMNPGRENEFQLAKDESSIAHFPPDREKGYLLYATYIFVSDRIINCVVSGFSMSVEKACYNGFPDPPKADPKFKVGDRITLKGGHVHGNKSINGVRVKEWDEPPISGLVVTEITSYQCSDRSWQYRVHATGPSGRDGYECSECLCEHEVTTNGQ